MVVIVATVPLPGTCGEFHPEQVAAEINVALDIDLVVRPPANPLRPLRPQKLAGPRIGQPGKPVPQGEVFGLFDFRAACAGRHDGDPPVIEGFGGERSDIA